VHHAQQRGAALLTHGLAIFAVPVFATALWRRPGATSARLLGLVVFDDAALLLPAAASVSNSLAAGSLLFSSHNVGINLYIGNQPDLDRTLARRTGYEWESFFAEPRRQGFTRAAELDDWFVRESIAAWREAPAAMLATAARKVAQVVAGSELKRNFPIEPLRADSRLLRAFLWPLEAGGRVLFAFPTGLVLPLAALGFAVLRRGRFPTLAPAAAASLPAWVAAAFAVGMVVFFPATRYRVTAVALALPYAAIGGIALWNAIRGRARLGWAVALGSFAVLLFVNAVASNVHRHPDRDLAEQRYYEARYAMQQLARGEDPALEAVLVSKAEAAMRLDPTYPEPVELLAAFYLTRDLAKARAHFEDFSAMVPADAEGRLLLERVLRQLETGS